MEAIRVQPGETVTQLRRENHDAEEDPTLSAPPRPFPVDELAQHRPRSRVQDTAASIQAVQASMIRYLESFIADDFVVRLPDKDLVRVLTELLEATYELESTQSFASSSAQLDPSSLPPGQVLEHLSHQLSSLYISTLSRPPPTFNQSIEPRDLHPAIHFVHEELVWSRVESLTHAALSMIRSGSQENDSPEGEAEIATPVEHAVDPPHYTLDQPEESLPHYAPDDYDEATDDKSESPHSMSDAADEKMHQDLMNVYDAIDRLHTVAPGYHDQRSELRPGLSQADRRQAEIRREREKMRELEKIWNLIERTHKGRQTDKQRAEIWGGLDGQASAQATASGRFSGTRSINRDLALAEDLRRVSHRAVSSLISQRDAEVKRLLVPELSAHEAAKHAQRQAFIADILSRSKAGRLVDQEYPTSFEDTMKDKRKQFVETLVDFSSSRRYGDQDSLPPTPKTASGIDNTSEIVTVGDFLRSSSGPKTLGRSRSQSLPIDDAETERPKTTMKQKLSGMIRRSSAALHLQSKIDQGDALSYLAEYQENLHTIQLMVHGPGLLLKEQYVLETSSSGPSRSANLNCQAVPFKLPIQMPCHVPGSQSVPMTLSDLHLESKLRACPSVDGSLDSTLRHPFMSSELRSISPSGLCCATCSRQLAHLTSVLDAEARSTGAGFKNLPSEHWAEMMEVWMCHPDPAFTSRVAQRNRTGFWPADDQVLIGNNYLLIHPDDLVIYNCKNGNLDQTGRWASLTCICGQTLGKQYEVPGEIGHGTVKFYKWSVGLIATGLDTSPEQPCFSTYVVSDMLELAQAHATYRFNVLDEETGTHRLWLWLFTPSLRVAYRTCSSALPTPNVPTGSTRKSASTDKSRESAGIRASKIMYQIPDDVTSECAMFGEHSQVEELRYPREICERLAETLLCSTLAYPVAKRKMGSFSVGFLERV
ncbi:HECT-like ubiquitin-conjugating enzyme-binding-domain-containing protein [Kockovaella imperatae]|uniref:HECT-like ubiquitin-conjugating enzyme-binding-domain-containing protein n=1 Tax=Kockovaella imperatae TaxID=4999 RepID=A0A1Y1UE45_9TREE|nr:HECT-like ubiquitin-conjugating enzyme-binding-domain-containing protein [Kockovaella imperatae]ORX36313.1 HECT-like ubiquitin-conjugating enzyme-binding-domain-containing protein [Kockovaella imperatae]